MPRPKKINKELKQLNDLVAAKGFKESGKALGMDIYKLTLKCVGRIFKSEGDTFEDAINKIKISGGANALSVLSVEKDGRKKDVILRASHTQGIFGQGSPTLKAIRIKGLKSIAGI